MKEMALNSANAHNSDVDREIIQKDFTSHMRTIADIAATTNYDGRLLLNGDYREPAWVTRESSVAPVVDPVDPIDPSAEPTALTRITAGFTLMEGSEVRPYTSSVGLTASRAFSGNVRVQLDFTGVKMKATGEDPSCPEAFDGKGFSILCAGCRQYVDIQFDASTTESTYIQHASPTISWARKYVIGIKDVTDAADLPEAIFLGIKNADGRTEEALRGCYLAPDGETKIDGADFAPEYYRNAAKDSADGNSISVDCEHNLRIEKDGSTYTLKRDVGPSMGLYDGLSDDDPPIPPPVPPDPDPYHEEYDPGNPLIIHTGPKANQHLRVYINSMHPIAMGLNRAAVNPWERAVESLAIIDRALEYALNENTRMGAYQVRLNETEDNLVTAEENTTSSMSKIRDADMAKEMATYTKNNVLTQSAQSMLSQANQNVGGVLDLLQ